MKRTFVLFAAMSYLVTAQPAAAQQAVDMVGTWKGKATAAHLGSNPYRDTKGNVVNFPDEILEFTFVIKEQKGNRFGGTSTAGGRSETIVGALSPDGTNGLMLDDDGQYMMTIKDQNTINVCYFHANSSGRVVACYPLNRAQ